MYSDNNNNNYEPPSWRCRNTTTKGTRRLEKGLFLAHGCGLLLVSNPFFGSPCGAPLGLLIFIVCDALI